MASADLSPILLDPWALLWVGGDEPIARDAEAELQAASDAGVPLIVSPISAWKIGLLVSRRRIVLAMEPRVWFRRALDAGVELAPMPPYLLIASSFLPASDISDPADRILAATARTFGYRLMTRDQPLLDYAAAGHLRAIAC